MKNIEHLKKLALLSISINENLLTDIKNAINEDMTISEVQALGLNAILNNSNQVLGQKDMLTIFVDKLIESARHSTFIENGLNIEVTPQLRAKLLKILIEKVSAIDLSVYSTKISEFAEVEEEYIADYLDSDDSVV